MARLIYKPNINIIRIKLYYSSLQLYSYRFICVRTLYEYSITDTIS